jgi:hypothetical protein
MSSSILRKVLPGLMAAVFAATMTRHLARSSSKSPTLSSSGATTSANPTSAHIRAV